MTVARLPALDSFFAADGGRGGRRGENLMLGNVVRVDARLLQRDLPVAMHGIVGERVRTGVLRGHLLMFPVRRDFRLVARRQLLVATHRVHRRATHDSVGRVEIPVRRVVRR